MPHRWSSNPIAPAAAILLALAAVGCDPQSSGTAPPATPAQPRGVFALGSLEPAGGVISVSAAPGDRLKTLDPDVAVNHRAPANGILGLMASYDTRLAQLKALQTKREMAAEKHELDVALADAQLKSADASLAQARAKLTEVRMQKQRLSYLEEAASIAQADFKRLEKLAQTDADLVTPHQLRRQANRADQAQKDFEIAQATFTSALEAAESAQSAAEANRGAAQQTRDTLHKTNPVRAVDEEIRLAQKALAQSVLHTPDIDPSELDAVNVECVEDGDEADGPYTVLKVFLRRGEAVTQTPVLQVGDLSKIVCVAEVYEADAKNIKTGQKATISSRAFQAPFDSGIEGTVESISRVVASAGLAARNPLAAVDRSVVAVRVAIDPKNAEAIAEAGRWIGLRVDIEFEL